MTDPKDPALDAGDPFDLLDDLDAEEAEGLADDEPRENEDGEDEGDDGDEPESGAKDKGGKPSRVQKRIDQLTRQARDAERERDYYRTEATSASQRIQELENWARSVQPTQQQIQQGRQGGQSPEQVRELVQREARNLVEEERFKEGVATLAGKLKAEAPEAFSRLSNPALTMFEDEAVEALQETANPVRVAKVIAGNEELFKKFSELPNGIKRAQFIARLDGQIEARRAAKAAPAAAAVTPKVRGASRAPDKDPEKMDQGEYEAWRKKQGWG